MLITGRHSAVPPTPAPSSSPGGPTNFQAVDQGPTVQLTWTDNSQGTATYFIVYRGDGSNPQQQSVTVGLGRTSAAVGGLDPTVGYCFRLGAVLPKGTGHTFAYADASIRGCVAVSPSATP